VAEIPVQVNGKLRGHVEAPFGTPQDELQSLALSLDKIKQFVDGKRLVKVVVIPDKLINLVVK
jgi:leucyl-tRNA synthetase